MGKLAQRRRHSSCQIIGLHQQSSEIGSTAQLHWNRPHKVILSKNEMLELPQRAKGAWNRAKVVIHPGFEATKPFKISNTIRYGSRQSSFIQIQTSHIQLVIARNSIVVAVVSVKRIITRTEPIQKVWRRTRICRIIQITQGVYLTFFNGKVSHDFSRKRWRRPSQSCSWIDFPLQPNLAEYMPSQQSQGQQQSESDRHGGTQEDCRKVKCVRNGASSWILAVERSSPDWRRQRLPHLSLVSPRTSPDSHAFLCATNKHSIFRSNSHSDHYRPSPNDCALQEARRQQQTSTVHSNHSHFY